jgi:hypothetical protein
MKKIASLVLIVVFGFYSIGFSESLRWQIKELKEDLKILKQRVDSMTIATMPIDLGMYLEETNPAELGDMRPVTTKLVLNACDSITGWAVEASGAVELDTEIKAEGTGSIKHSVAAVGVSVATYTKPSGSFDLTNYNYITARVRTSAPLTTVKLYMGEATYDEQSLNIDSQVVSGDFYRVTWGIAAIGASSKNAITKISIGCDAVVGGWPLWIDDIVAWGNSQLMALTGNGLMNVLPKVYQGTYTGDGSDPKTITLSRKGHPTAIFIQGNAALASGGRPYLWLNTMGDNLAARLDGGGVFDAAMITEVGDCYFKVGSVMNTNTTVFHYLVLWSD